MGAANEAMLSTCGGNDTHAGGSSGKEHYSLLPQITTTVKNLSKNINLWYNQPL
jgi:hypothetical protein